MRTVIPEVIQVDCDFCGASVGVEENKIKLSGSSLDRGVPVGPAYMSGDFDCCFDCYSTFTKLIKSLRGD